MITVVIGGSGSGKSEYAEAVAVQAAAEAPSKELTVATTEVPLVYIATMQPFGEETLAKIARHHELRKHKGFTTYEQYVDVAEVAMKINGQEDNTNADSKNAVVLLECMSNLLANEMYRADGVSATELVPKILADLRMLEASCKHLIVVTNDVFASGESFDEETMQYVQHLGAINCELAKSAMQVIEVVCGIAVPIQKEGVTYV